MIVLSFLIIVVLVVLHRLNKKNAYWKERGVPFPKPKLLFGNAYDILSLRTSMSIVFCSIYKEFKGCSYVGFLNMWNPAIIVRDPELIKDVLIKQFNNFHDNWIETEDTVDSTVAYNPFVLRGDKWKSIRTQLTPQFTTSRIKSTFPEILVGCKNMVEYIKKVTKSKGSNTIEVKDLSARFTGDNVMKCAYGLEGQSFITDKPDTFKIGEQVSSSSVITKFKQTITLYFPVLRKLLKTTFIGDPVPNIFKDIILEAVKYRKEHYILRNDYLDYIRTLKTKSSISGTEDEYLIAHAFTFFLDGFQTSATTLAYALFELSTNPDIQITARKEIQTVLEKHGGNLTYESFQEMEYLENVIFETLRKYPIIKFLSRVCTEEFTFPPAEDSPHGKEVIIEKGTHIFIPVEGVHYDTDFYTDPEKFDPDRFTEEIKSTRPKYTFFGFGEGPRICLGRKFALAQLKLGLMTILSEFQLKLNEDTILPLQQENQWRVPGNWESARQVLTLGGEISNYRRREQQRSAIHKHV